MNSSHILTYFVIKEISQTSVYILQFTTTSEPQFVLPLPHYYYFYKSVPQTLNSFYNILNVLLYIIYSVQNFTRLWCHLYKWKSMNYFILSSSKYSVKKQYSTKYEDPYKSYIYDCSIQIVSVWFFSIKSQFTHTPTERTNSHLLFSLHQNLCIHVKCTSSSLFPNGYMDSEDMQVKQKYSS